jgi:hypothetical protein
VTVHIALDAVNPLTGQSWRHTPTKEEMVRAWGLKAMILEWPIYATPVTKELIREGKAKKKK